MPFVRREAKIENLIMKHFDAVEGVLSKFYSAFQAFMHGSGDFISMLEDVHAAEDSADHLRRRSSTCCSRRPSSRSSARIT